MNRFVGCSEGFHTVAAEIVRSMLHVVPGSAKRRDGFSDLGMWLSSRSGRSGSLWRGWSRGSGYWEGQHKNQHCHHN
jgi:hypothetical protein